MLKTNKGITLVALIITIIILLILAVVAISAVSNTGIIQYAQNSAGAYKDGRDKENGILQGYMNYINKNNPYKEEINQDNWDYAWICTETAIDGQITRVWQNTMYTPQTLPSEYVIIVKFYRNIDEDKISIEGLEDYPYTMKIEGSGEMPELRDSAENSYAWCKQVHEYSGTGGIFIICTTEIEIDKRITHIGDNAFEMALGLKEIKYNGTKAEWDNITYGTRTFKGVSASAKIVCSDGTEVDIPNE